MRMADSLLLERGGKGASRGLTLVELLVVIAIIAILAGMVFPGLSQSKQKSQGTACLSNLRQLDLGWNIYANDFNQFLVINRGDHHLNTNNYYDNWVSGNVSSLPDETNTLLLANSLLGPYVKNYAVYKCPADPGNPAGTPRVRSISMNNYMNGVGIDILSNDFSYSTKLSQIMRPASSFVFLDERAGTINDGYFVVELTTNYFALRVLDMPANYHGFAGGFAFPDGHAQIKKWLTLFFQNPPTLRISGAAPQNQDYIWLMQNTTVPTSGAWP
jgi:prepilin-type N-terminal cleavage/methylation domain-containing protein